MQIEDLLLEMQSGQNAIRNSLKCTFLYKTARERGRSVKEGGGCGKRCSRKIIIKTTQAMTTWNLFVQFVSLGLSLRKLICITNTKQIVGEEIQQLFQ